MVARLAARVKPSGLTTVVKIGFFCDFRGLASGVRVVLRFSDREPPTPSLPHGGGREALSCGVARCGWCWTGGFTPPDPRGIFGEGKL
jgi:hypothetical protein